LARYVGVKYVEAEPALDMDGNEGYLVTDPDYPTTQLWVSKLVFEARFKLVFPYAEPQSPEAP